jgi:hypothetical protein
MDPLSELLPVAAEHGAWVHVDAAMAGSALLLPECRDLVAGLGGVPGAPTGRTRSAGTRTNGWARCWTAPCSTFATRGCCCG